MQRINFKHSSHDRNWNHDKHNCVCPWPPNTMEKRKYIPTSQDINKATLYLYSLCLAIRNTSLDFSALRFATLFRSRAFASSARALFLSFFTASASAARLGTFPTQLVLFHGHEDMFYCRHEDMFYCPSIE